MSDRIILDDFLKTQGCSPSDIQRIHRELEAYDERIVRQSIFDSVDGGSFDIESVIKQAILDAQATESPPGAVSG